MDSQSNNDGGTEVVYKTKIIQFLGRCVPIILQNDNGPCPLLAICNVLLLRNNLNLSLETDEIASSRLLSLVAERLLDSNSNIGNKDDEYAYNQQQNISDAISLLPNLATGLDVNVRFRNIHDFEFTPECAVFDLLDISLVHGWLCDPQDEVTSEIIGDKSYNTLAERLVELQTAESRHLDLASSDDVEFPVTTEEFLRVASPFREAQLKTEAFSELETYDIADAKQRRKGDAEEEAQLLQALNNSMVDIFSAEVDPSSNITDNANNGGIIQNHENVVPPVANQQPVDVDNQESYRTSCNNKNSSLQISARTDGLHRGDNGGESSIFQQNDGSHDGKKSNTLAISELLTACVDKSKVLTEKRTELLDINRINLHQDSATEPVEANDSGHAIVDQPSLLVHDRDVSLNSSSPGETEVGTSGTENRKPLYEEGSLAGCPHHFGLEEEGIIIRNFLQSHASQLTIYGLFCLQEGLKERELCVFFRNNHFNTMFKYNGQLYLLVTDQGYLNQSDIVWEKLDEVHGDTVLMTGAFVPFQGDEGNGLWDEQRVIAATEEFLSSQKDSSLGNVEAHTNRDLQLAMSLQHQEFEQQKQTRSSTSTSGRPQSQTVHHGRTDGSKLITGPRRSAHPSKPDPKSKCAVM